MKLTGKAQEDFDLWFFERNTPIEEYKNYPNLSETCKNALIVEWFDSVGIYIHIEPYLDFNKKLLFKNYVLFYTNIDEQNSYLHRVAATNAAIEKANELYNNDK